MMIPPSIAFMQRNLAIAIVTNAVTDENYREWIMNMTPIKCDPGDPRGQKIAYHATQDEVDLIINSWRNKSMSNIKGVVASKSRAGTGIKVDDRWYNATKDMLAPIEWKDTIEAEIDADGKKIVSIKKVEGAATAQPSPSNTEAWDARQKSILWQSARKDAVSLLGIVLTQVPEAVKIPAKQADKLDAVVALVNDLNRRLYDTSQNFEEE